MTELSEFIQVANEGLAIVVNEGDYDALVNVMGHLRDINKRQVATDNMFDPLWDTIQLLKSYDQPIPQEIESKLEVCIILSFSQKRNLSFILFLHLLMPWLFIIVFFFYFIFLYNSVA